MRIEFAKLETAEADDMPVPEESLTARVDALTEQVAKLTAALAATEEADEPGPFDDVPDNILLGGADVIDVAPPDQVAVPLIFPLSLINGMTKGKGGKN